MEAYTSPVKTKQMTPLFVTMHRDSVNLVKDQITPIGSDYLFLFDIDETLYKNKKLVEDETILTKKIYEKYVTEGHPPFEELTKRETFYVEYMHKHFGLHPTEMRKEFESFDYSLYIQPDEQLRSMLMNIKYRKWCFTNAQQSRAESILNLMGIADCFEGVICFDDCKFDGICKPNPSSFKFVEELLGVTNSSSVIFFDDNIHNVKAANSMGWNGKHVPIGDSIVNVLNKLFPNVLTDVNNKVSF